MIFFQQVRTSVDIFKLKALDTYLCIVMGILLSDKCSHLQVMVNSAEKIRLAGNPNVMVCERGTMFGYSKL